METQPKPSVIPAEKAQPKPRTETVLKNPVPPEVFRQQLREAYLEEHSSWKNSDGSFVASKADGVMEAYQFGVVDMRMGPHLAINDTIADIFRETVGFVGNYDGLGQQLDDLGWNRIPRQHKHWVGRMAHGIRYMRNGQYFGEKGHAYRRAELRTIMQDYVVLRALAVVDQVKRGNLTASADFISTVGVRNLSREDMDILTVLGKRTIQHYLPNGEQVAEPSTDKKQQRASYEKIASVLRGAVSNAHAYEKLTGLARKRNGLEALGVTSQDLVDAQAYIDTVRLDLDRSFNVPESDASLMTVPLITEAVTTEAPTTPEGFVEAVLQERSVVALNQPFSRSHLQGRLGHDAFQLNNFMDDGIIYWGVEPHLAANPLFMKTWDKIQRLGLSGDFSSDRKGGLITRLAIYEHMAPRDYDGIRISPEMYFEHIPQRLDTFRRIQGDYSFISVLSQLDNFHRKPPISEEDVMGLVMINDRDRTCLREFGERIILTYATESQRQNLQPQDTVSQRESFIRLNNTFKSGLIAEEEYAALEEKLQRGEIVGGLSAQDIVNAAAYVSRIVEDVATVDLSTFDPDRLPLSLQERQARSQTTIEYGEHDEIGPDLLPDEQAEIVASQQPRPVEDLDLQL